MNNFGGRHKKVNLFASLDCQCVGFSIPFDVALYFLIINQGHVSLQKPVLMHKHLHDAEVPSLILLRQFLRSFECCNLIDSVRKPSPKYTHTLSKHDVLLAWREALFECNVAC